MHDFDVIAWATGFDFGTGALSRMGFGESSYYFGSNIPGKPRRYLLNSGGRPKLFKEIARVVESDYAAFRLSRAGVPADARTI